MKNNLRQYIRISTVLPIEFFLVDKQGKKITPWIQGFTHDIGKGGICLLVNDLWWGFWDKFNQAGNRVFLRIKLPLKKEPLFLEADIRWLESEKLKKFYQHKIGLEFVAKSNKKSNSIFKFAVFKKITPIVVVSGLTIFILISSFLFYRTVKLAKENKRLVSGYVDIIQKNSYLAQNLEENKKARDFLVQRKENLNKKIEDLNQDISAIKSEYNQLKEVKAKNKQQLVKLNFLEDKISESSQRLEALNRENKFLKEKIEEKKKVTTQIKEEAKQLGIKKQLVSEKVIAGMYDWIKNRQDLARGLILSYEGDSSLGRVSFTYDQALAVFVFLNFKDLDRAEKILDFYLKRINKDKMIYNGYFTDGGVFEYVAHSGPQAWIGLAALNYINETGNNRYLNLAIEVANFLIKMQDEEGGIVGGPENDWYSTEHNLDAYAFFDLLYKQTKNIKYKNTAEKIKKWISKYSYTDHKIPINRGKGDATIATDTYTWSITALGLEKLYSMGMDPEEILEFAEKNCKVTVNFKYKNREVTVEGFDFAKTKHVGRGGVVSGEWTAQMILAYEVMADYFKNRDNEKYHKYLKKAHFYFNQLQKMTIISLSRAGRVEPCLPYASAPYVNTGHGWRTPRGRRTGSLASTAYFLIAYQGYNPLQSKFLDVSLKGQYQNE